MINERFFLNMPLSFKDKFYVFPPTIKQVVGTERYNSYLKVFTVSQEEIEEELADKIEDGDDFPTPFEFLLGNSYHNDDFCSIVKQAFQFFCHINVELMYEEKKILIGGLESIEGVNSLDQLIFLEESEFLDFQNLIRASIGEKELEELPDDMDPRLKRMKILSRTRDRVKAKQSAKGDGINFTTFLSSICCMGIGINPLNIGELSYVSAKQLFAMMQEKAKYELDINSLLAGADSKKVKPKHWIRNLDD